MIKYDIQLSWWSRIVLLFTGRMTATCHENGSITLRFYNGKNGYSAVRGVARD